MLDKIHLIYVSESAIVATLSELAAFKRQGLEF